VILWLWAQPLANADPGVASGAEVAAASPSTSSLSIGAMPARLATIASSAARLPLPERISLVSEALLGLPYVSDPMGEGVLPDADPVARYDAFDCLTYVEEVLALSMAGDPVHAAEIRDALRYDEGPRDYVHRRHFMELQWIPGTLRAGLLRDTTRSYGRTVALDKEVTPATWSAWSGRKNFLHTDTQLPLGHMHLDVLPLDEAVRVADRLPAGSILLTVRQDRAGVPLWITHVSLIVMDSAGQKVVRHATLVGTPDQTRDHGLLFYLNHLRTYANWPVLGVAVLEPVEQQPRFTR
jgi:Protein of unknown function (DUF1460)